MRKNTKMTKEKDCRQKDSTATTMTPIETIKENTALISESLPLDIPLQPFISNLDINDYSTKPINIRLKLVNPIRQKRMMMMMTMMKTI